MGSLLYYAALILLWQMTAYPQVLLLAVVLLAARRYLPDPYLWLKHQGRVRGLVAAVEANPDNVTARRDLAVIWLERRRPRRALPILAEASQREPESAELRYLTGHALLESGQPEAALDPLVKAVRQQERIRYGEGYLLCARALCQLRRYPEAEDALLRFLRINTSSIEGRVRLAQVRQRQGDDAGARKARAEARATFRQLPSFRRRKELRWYLRSLLPFA